MPHKQPVQMVRALHNTSQQSIVCESKEQVSQSVIFQGVCLVFPALSDLVLSPHTDMHNYLKPYLFWSSPQWRKKIQKTGFGSTAQVKQILNI